MNKRSTRFIAVLLLTCMLMSACSKKDDRLSDSFEDARDSAKNNAVGKIIDEEFFGDDEQSVIAPDIIQIRSICDLAVMECYYHNLARAKKEAGTGLIHYGEDDKIFWVEYTAQATLGIDASRVEMEIVGNKITVYIPRAGIIGNITIDRDSIGEPVYEPNRWYINDVEITAADVTEAISEANAELEEMIMADSSLIYSAELRTQQLIANYIDQIIALSGQKYDLNFVVID